MEKVDKDVMIMELEESMKAVKIAFSTHDGQKALKYLQEIFSRSTSVKSDVNGAVDPNATLVCEGSRQVIIHIEECIDDDFRD